MKKLLIIFSLFTMTYASSEHTVKKKDNNSIAMIKDISYVNMSTEQLQKEVEKRSINGDLSFNMGLELIKRWSNS